MGIPILRCGVKKLKLSRRKTSLKVLDEIPKIWLDNKSKVQRRLQTHISQNRKFNINLFTF